jgi:hypothetical protein
VRTISDCALLVVVVALIAACSSAAEAPAPAPATASSSSATSTTEPPLLFGGATDTTLVVAPGYGPLVALDLDTGNAQRFDDTDGVPGDFPFRVTGLESGVAYPGSGGVLTLPWSFDGPPMTIGRSWFFVPSGRADHLWLVDPPSDGNDEVGLREVDAAGEVTATTAIPPGTYAMGGVGDLLVVQDAADLNLFDPARRSFTTSLGPAVLLATEGDRLAVTEGCDGCAAIRVIDLGAPDEDDTVETSGHPTDAAFSPDGRWLAIWALSEDGTAASLDLLDLTTGEATPIRGSEAGPYADVVWSNDSSWVFVMSRGEVQSGTMITAFEVGAPAAVMRTTPHMQSGTIVAIPAGEGPDLGSRPDERTCPLSDGLDANGNPLSAVTKGHPCRLPISD